MRATYIFLFFYTFTSISVFAADVKCTKKLADIGSPAGSFFSAEPVGAEIIKGCPGKVGFESENSGFRSFGVYSLVRVLFSHDSCVYVTPSDAIYCKMP